ncbi:MAG: magnesium transporter [Proteobacteria bacterium]|nr:magnesium transporter [Pseudomonadota bacterium]
MTEEIKSSLPREFDSWLSTKNFKSIRPLLKSAEPADIGEKISDLPLNDLLLLFRLIPRQKRAEVFAYIPFERQEELLESLPEAVITSLLNDMEPDDRTRLLEDLPFEIRSQILLKLSPEERSMAWQLLSYQEDSVGRLMNPEFIAVKGEMKVAEAFEYIRWTVRDSEELHSHLYVVDSQGRLQGEIQLAQLILADPPSQLLSQFMESSVVSLNAKSDKGSAVDVFRKYDKPFLPVVDDQDVLVGVLTSDDVFDIAEEEATEEIQQFGGSAHLEDSYFQTPWLTLLKKRAGWLSMLFIGGLFTSTVMHHFDQAILTMSYLVYFVPLVISSGGNSGSQVASLVIRGLAVKEMELADWFRVFKRELVMGLSLGTILGVIGFVRGYAWEGNVLVGIIVGLSLVGIVLFGCVVGALMPFVIKFFKMDPAVSSSPFIASVVDVSGIIIYFTVALWVTRWLSPILHLIPPAVTGS